MNPRFPLYIVSKGRHETRYTSKSLEAMKVPYFIVIEEQEYDLYAAVIDPEKILVLDKNYQEIYDPCDDLGFSMPKGSGAARNFAWEHSLKSGHAWHWVMDDNIQDFYRLHDNLKIKVADGTIFRCMEDFVLRYDNISMAGPNYDFFAPRKKKIPAFIMNTRIYSCNLIRNDVPFRWRGRFNEDTILSIDMMKKGWCTVLFNAFLQGKMQTLKVKGGNTEILYANGANKKKKSKMLVDIHGDVSRISFKFGRWHHHVDYRPFKHTELKLRSDVILEPVVNNYGMSIKKVK